MNLRYRDVQALFASLCCQVDKRLKLSDYRVWKESFVETKLQKGGRICRERIL